MWLPNKPFKLQVFIRLLLSKSSCNDCSIFAQLENFNSKRQRIFIPPQTALQWHPRLITLTPIFLLPHARKYDNIHENSWQFHFFYNLLRQINIHSNISLLLCLNFLSFLKFRNMMINMVTVRLSSPFVLVIWVGVLTSLCIQKLSCYNVSCFVVSHGESCRWKFRFLSWFEVVL